MQKPLNQPHLPFPSLFTQPLCSLALYLIYITALPWQASFRLLQCSLAWLNAHKTLLKHYGLLWTRKPCCQHYTFKSHEPGLPKTHETGLKSDIWGVLFICPLGFEPLGVMTSSFFLQPPGLEKAHTHIVCMQPRERETGLTTRSLA